MPFFLLALVTAIVLSVVNRIRAARRGASPGRPPVVPFAIAAIGFLVAISGETLVRIVTDGYWWSEELGRGRAYRTLLTAEYGWGLALAILATLFLALNLWWVRRVTDPHEAG